MGRLKESLRLFQEAHELEPFVPVYNIFFSPALIANGQSQAAIAALEALPPNTLGGYREEILAPAYVRGNGWAGLFVANNRHKPDA
jgi:hypothetical protein